jgi:predicted metal-dependent HD superfamily phosphohydrolase
MEDLTQKVEEEVTIMLREKLDGKYAYHNFQHTKRVVKEASKLADAMSLQDLEREKLVIAAWFHDTGYLEGYKDHEQSSADRVSVFLEKYNYDKEGIEEIRIAILETKYPHNPQSKLGKILCDADLSGVGKASYFDSTSQLRSEMKETCGKGMTEKEWLAGEIKFLSEHSYLTEAGKTLYEEQKQANIAKLKTMQEDLQSSDQPDSSAEISAENKKVKGKKKAEKAKAYSRGVETMFRAGARTHINLSSMADSKANIMLSINAMIISVTLTVLIPKLDSNAHLVAPTLVLLATCLASIVLATLSTRPVVNKGLSSKEDIANRKSNLLFFGNFHSMELDDYEDGMKQMMEDNDFLYGSLTRDMYFLGKVLNKKYRYLRICYTIFMYGMIASVLAYGYAFWSMG